jgi:mRNA interferase RelE/StbE
MARYEVRFRKSVAKDLDPIPKRDVQRILKAIEALAGEPRHPQSRKLSGGERYRLCCGVYQVLYEIQDEVLLVCVVKAALREDVCRKRIERRTCFSAK